MEILVIEAFSHHTNLEIIYRQSETLLVTAVNELERGHVTDNTVTFLNSLNRHLPNEQLQQAIHLFEMWTFTFSIMTVLKRLILSYVYLNLKMKD